MSNNKESKSEISTDLKYIKEAEMYQKIISDDSITQEELAERLGKSQSTIANKLRLLNLSPAVICKLAEYGLKERHARALVRIKDENLQLQAVNLVFEKKLNVPKTEDFVEKVLQKQKASS